MKFQKKLLSLMLLLLAYAPNISSTERTQTEQELSDYYHNLLEEAILLEENGGIEQAEEIYNEIITSNQVPEFLLIEALTHKAKMLYNAYEGSTNYTEKLPSIIELLKNVVNHPAKEEYIQFWAEAHLLLAQIYLDLFAENNDLANIKSAIKHYGSILTSPFTIDPKITFKAALHYTELVNIYSDDLGLKINTRIPSEIMLETYYNMIPQEERNNDIPSQLDLLRVLLQTKLRTDLAMAQQLIVLPQVNSPISNAVQARKLLNNILIAPYNDSSILKIKNRARLILAGMNLRGQGLPNNAPNVPAATELYQLVASQPEDSVMKGDKNKAAVALNLMNRNQKRKRTEIEE